MALINKIEQGQFFRVATLFCPAKRNPVHSKPIFSADRCCKALYKMKRRPVKSSHLHAHRAGDAAHHHYVEGRNEKILGFSLLLTLGFAVIEAFAGFWSNSLALLSDAGHMATDTAALTLALLAQLIAKRPPSAKHSFGFGRAEALAAFVNGLAMLAVVGWIAVEAVQRLAAPQAVEGETVFIVALIGLMVNLLVAWLLSHDKQSVNTRAALVHVLGDLLGSIAALIAGAVIYFTGWLPIDPLLSIFVSLLILKSTISVLRESSHFLMKGVPHHIDYLQVGEDLAAIKGVLSVHDLHIWEMTPGQPALIGHVEIRDLQEWPAVLSEVHAMLLEKHGIDHVTLQAELPGMAEGR
ncbi:MAG: cobalt-zinc-cadmium efflux system protein [Burkholderiales bacterium]